MLQTRTWPAVGGVFAGLLVLAACAHRETLLNLNPDYRLGYDDKGASVALAFGLPNSDDLALMLECAKGSGQIELSDSTFDRATVQIVLAAGGRTTRVPVRVSDPEEGGGLPPILVGRLAPRAAALQAFRQSGVLDVGNGASHYVITVPADRKAGVERFFRECG